MEKRALISPPPTWAEICERSSPLPSYLTGDFNCSRNKRSRNATLATRAFPCKATAFLILARNPTLSKSATGALLRSRNRKCPSTMLTLWISDANPVGALRRGSGGSAGSTGGVADSPADSVGDWFGGGRSRFGGRSEEHTSELQPHSFSSYAL